MKNIYSMEEVNLIDLYWALKKNYKNVCIGLGEDWLGGPKCNGLFWKNFIIWDFKNKQFRRWMSAIEYDINNKKSRIDKLIKDWIPQEDIEYNWYCTGVWQIFFSNTDYNDGQQFQISQVDFDKGTIHVDEGDDWRNQEGSEDNKYGKKIDNKIKIIETKHPNDIFRLDMRLFDQWMVADIEKTLKKFFDQKPNLSDIIAWWENDAVEFKSSLRRDCKQNIENVWLEYNIIKNIAAFLNSRWGKLYIGVNDDWEVVWIENDYKSLKNKDGFLKQLDNIVRDQFSEPIHNNISFEIKRIESKEICIVNIIKSKVPIHTKKEEFFIRWAASSQPLPWSKATKYIAEHFPYWSAINKFE